MKNPWTIDGERVKISGSDYDWEKHGDLNDPNNPPHVNVNEGLNIWLTTKKHLLSTQQVAVGQIFTL
jgi:GH43 family beta-xylosidase